MAIAQTVTSTVSRAVSEKLLFAATFTGFVVWDFGGHIDAWYHQHYGFAIESFITWPHALLYVGWIASAIPAAAYLFESRAQGLPRSTWLPAGYPLVLAGAVVFGLGGVFDMWWHTTFGFEIDQEALVSPSHLVLICSAGLGYFGLVWVAVDRRRRLGARGFAVDATIAAALGMLLRHSFYALIYSQPFSTDYVSGGSLTRSLFGFEGIKAWSDMTAQVAGISGIVLYAVVTTLFVVVAMRSLRLATGAILVMLLWNEVFSLVSIPEMWVYVPAVIVSAGIGELIWSAMGRGALGGRDARPGYWVMGAAVPGALFAAYLVLTAIAGGGIAWPTNIWTGAPVLAAVYGLVASVLAIPPRFASAVAAETQAGPKT